MNDYMKALAFQVEISVDGGARQVGLEFDDLDEANTFMTWVMRGRPVNAEGHVVDGYVNLLAVTGRQNQPRVIVRQETWGSDGG